MDPFPFNWHLFLNTLARMTFAWLLTLPTAWFSEREGNATGIRTFPIVAMASCGYLLIFNGAADMDALNSRVLQGLIAGIGFIGGGAIVKDGVSVRGTATAASIWNTGAIGAAVAVDKIETAVVLASLNILTLQALVPVKKRIDEVRRREQADSIGVSAGK